MSKTIDERVVEMRFDNKQFESNVATSMSTLDKLKQKLNLSGASKGLEEIESASKRVNMSGLGGAVESVSAKFSAMQVIGITALTNITNQAVNTGKRIAAALTIDPIKSGLQEYETQINAVQTILANTSSKGTTIDDVNAALDELNKYADLTIYNFTEMTRNIGTFTAAGVDLETSVNAIQGIANLAAVSGSTSQQASTAMYQLSQALATGTVKLMDWNSVVNAGMGGEVFQNALKETSELLGTGAEAAISAEGSFRESLKTGWLTAEVLTETLKKFTTSGAAEYISKFTGLSQETVDATLEATDAWGDEADAIDKAAEALANKSGKNKDEIKAALEMAKTAQDAATKVKTFSQLWDVLKEAAQSGWSQTWRIIIGDFEEAKALLTPLADFFTNIINKMSDARNNLLESALGKSFTNLADRINGALKPAAAVVDTVEKVTGALGDLDEIVNKVIRGDFGNGEDRFNALTEAGENYYKIQNKVNETLGDSFRYSEDQIEAQEKLIGKQEETTEATSEIQEETVKLTDAQKDQIKTLAKLSDEELRAKGYTNEQIEAFRELRATAEKLGVPLEKFIDNLDEINGRWLLINSFKNIGQALIKVFSALGQAWREVFNPIQADQIFDVIAAVHKFTASMIPSEDAVKKLTRTFKGLFAVLDIVKTILGGGIRIALKAISQVLSYFHLDILDVTASIGDALVAFRDWFDSIFDISGVLDAVVPLVKKVASAIRKWFAVFKETPAVQKLVNAINTIGDAFRKLTSGKINISEFAASIGSNLARALKSLPEIALQIGKDFIAGFQNGISDSIGGVIKKIINFCLEFVSNFAEALGVHSPSWKAYEIVRDFFQGAINGAKSMFEPVLNVLKRIGEEIIKVFKGLWDFITDENGNIEWGKLFAGGAIVSMILVLKQLVTSFNGLANALGGIDDLIFNAGKVLKSFSKVLNGISWDLKAKALLKMAIAIGVLVAAIWILTQIDDIGKLWNAVGVITALALILIGLAVAMDKLNKASVDFDAKSKTFKASGFQKSLLQIGLAILAVAYAVKMIGNLDPEKARQGFIGLAEIAVGMIAFLAAMGGISRYSKDISGIGGMMMKLSIAMLLMVGVIKLVNGLSGNEMLKGAAFAAGFAIFVIAITRVAKSAGNNVSKVGGLVLKISIAMALMVGVCKLIGLLSIEEMLKGAAFAGAFVLFIAALVRVTKIGKEQQLAKISGLVLSVSFSLLLLVGVCKLVSLLSVEEMLKGAVFVAGFVVLLKTLTSILKIGDKDKMAKVAGTILAMSASIAILAGVAVLLSFMDIASLAKGIIAVGLLSTMMTIMVKSLKGAQNVKGAIMMMAVAIGVMAASIVALSFIDTKSLISSAGAMSIMMAAFALMIKSMKGLSRQKLPVKPIIAMVGVIIALAGVIALLSLLDLKSAVTNTAALSLLLLTLSSSLFIIGKAGNISKKVFKQLLTMTLVVAGLATILGIMSALNVEASIPTAIAIGILLNSLAASMVILGFAGPRVDKAVPAAMLMGVVLAEIALVLGLMSAFDVNPSIETAIALSTLILALSVACLIISRIPSAAAIDGAIGLAAFVGIMAAVVTALGALSQIPGFTELLADGGNALGLIGTAIGNFVGGIVGGVISGIGNAVIGLLPQLGIALSNFMVGAQPFIALAGNVDESVIIGAGYMTSAILLLTAADFLAGIAQFLNRGLSFSELGTQLLLLGTGAVSFFKLIEGVDSKAVKAAKNVADMILALSLSELIDTITGFLGGEVDYTTMGENLKTFGDAVVGFSDTIAGKLNTVAVNAAVNAGMMLAELNKALTRSGGLLQDLIGEKDFEKFATSCKAFAKCMININKAVSQKGFVVQSDKITQLISAGTQFNELNTALPRTDGIAQDLAGEKDLAKFGKACLAFAKCMININKAVSQKGFVVQSDKIAQLVSAGTKFNELNTALPKTDGIAQNFAGEKDLSKFGKACLAFAKCMVTVNSAISTKGFAVNLQGMEDIKQAGLKMNELQNSLPETGGWWKDVAGEKDIADFGSKIKTFGEAIVGFSTSAADLNTGAIDLAITTARRIKSLIASLSDIDTDGLATFTGIGTGGRGADGAAYQIAQAIAEFSSKVSDIDTNAVAISVSAAHKLRDLISSLSGLDTSGLENFKPQSVGSEMKGYADKVSGIDTVTVSSSISSADRLKNFIAGLAGLDTSGIGNFKISSIGSSIKEYGTSVSSVNFGAILTSIGTATTLKNFIAGLAGLDTSGVTSFKTALNQLSTVDITAIVNAFSGASSKMSSAGASMINGLINGMQSKIHSVKSVITSIIDASNSTITSKIQIFEKAGNTMATRLAAGFSSKKTVVNSAISSCLSDAVSKIRDKYVSFYNAGSYLVTGFCDGISANTYRAAAKAKAMADAAIEAAREELKINSPSKVFKEIGSGIPEGFAIGIEMLGGEVKQSVTDMTSTAINATRSTMDTILNALNSDMDAQPTIRPVIDLSNIKTGANAINGMFSGIQTVGVRSNLNAINSMMNAKLQNGSNDDIISAINKLNDGLKNNRGDTYNFGDFTYDDGSNINDAVQTLVRAAKMGRRV